MTFDEKQECSTFNVVPFAICTFTSLLSRRVMDFIRNDKNNVGAMISGVSSRHHSCKSVIWEQMIELPEKCVSMDT